MAPEKLVLDRATLRTFEHAAAGHDGVLSDASGALFIKPSTQQEIEFYQNTLNQRSALANLMPTFLGTLSLESQATMPNNTMLEVRTGESDAVERPGPSQSSHGRKIATDIAIVLENLEHGFKRPNVMDLKLGSRLYAPGTKPEKAARLDKVAAESTSGSLNFRIAGMKVWNGHEFDIYDKFYGRRFTLENIKDAFATFFAPLTLGLPKDYALHMLGTIGEEVGGICSSLKGCEIRIFSSSVLIIYEGDLPTLRSCMVQVDQDTSEKDHTGGDNTNEASTSKDDLVQDNADDEVSGDEEDDADDEPSGPVPYRVNLIDFAHAFYTPGEGNDQNVIQGLENIMLQLRAIFTRVNEG